MLDQQTAAFLEAFYAVEAPPVSEMTLAEIRQAFDQLFADNGLPPCDLVDRADRVVAGPHGPIPIRVYTPRTQVAGLRSGLVYFHGGGMVANSIDTYDPLVQHLSAESGCVVVSVGYRLAPEHRFPIPVDDAFAAATWVYDNALRLGIDPGRLAVGGDSAGGYLAAVVTQLARDAGGPPFAFQLLVYPAVGTRGYSLSLGEFATGYFFERTELDWVLTQYIADPADVSDPRVAPILAADFSRLPPAFVVTAECEIMRDDSELYGRLLRAAGVPVEVHRYLGTIHPFLNLAGVIDAGREAISECAQKVGEAVAAPAVQVADDNEFVRIIFVNVPAGDSVEHRAASDRTVIVDVADGSFCVDNCVDSVIVGPVNEIRVELKGAPPDEPMPDDAVVVDPSRYRVELDGDGVRVVRLRFDAGETGLMVSHPPRVLVTLSDVWVKVTFADGRTDERGAPRGLAAWLGAETLQTTNVGERPLEVVLVEPRSRRINRV